MAIEHPHMSTLLFEQEGDLLIDESFELLASTAGKAELNIELFIRRGDIRGKRKAASAISAKK
jgi:hypothetical protein